MKTRAESRPDALSRRTFLLTCAAWAAVAAIGASAEAAQVLPNATKPFVVEPPEFQSLTSNRMRGAGLVRIVLSGAPRDASLCARPLEGGGPALSLQYGVLREGEHFLKQADGTFALTLPVVGLAGSEIHRLAIRIVGPAGEEIEQSIDVNAALEAPGPFELPNYVNVETKVDPDESKVGFIFLDPRRNSPNKETQSTYERYGDGVFNLVDENHRLRFSVAQDVRPSGYEFLPNGNIVFMAGVGLIREIDLFGNTVKQWHAKKSPKFSSEPAPTGSKPVDTPIFHHSIAVVPKENGDYNVVAMSIDPRTVSSFYTNENKPERSTSPMTVVGDALLEFDSEGNTVAPTGRKREWNSLDHLDINRLGRETFAPYWVIRGFPDYTVDWSHGNNVQYLPRTKRLLVSFRVQSVVAMLNWDPQSPEFGTIQWLAGSPDGWGEKWKPLLLKSSDKEWFWHQHGVNFDEESNSLLVFNNNNFHVNAFETPVDPKSTLSRPEVWKVDEELRTISRTFPRPGDTTSDVNTTKILSTAMGNAQRLANGGVFAAYGVLFKSVETAKWGAANALKNGIWTTLRQYSSDGRLQWGADVRPPESDQKRDERFGWGLYFGHKVGTTLNMQGTLKSVTARGLWKPKP